MIELVYRNRYPFTNNALYFFILKQPESLSERRALNSLVLRVQLDWGKRPSVLKRFSAAGGNSKVASEALRRFTTSTPLLPSLLPRRFFLICFPPPP